MKGDGDRRVCVLGLGYIGLPTAAVLGSRGYWVHGVEVDPRAAETINSGRAHIVEPDLDILVQGVVSTGRLRANPHPAPADVFMICVPTPLRDDDAPDSSYVEEAARSIAPHVRAGNLVILESTSPPGTTQMVADIILKESGLDHNKVLFAHAPERVLPGKILREVVENDRIIGGLTDKATSACAEFYKTFVSGALHLTNSVAAETCKLVENAFRDVNIAFANELSLVCETLGLDVWEVIRLANRHPRVNILSPGPGVGGHCIAVDPYFIIDRAREQTPLMQAARRVNRGKPEIVAEKVIGLLRETSGKSVACLGLAYKPDIDDLRESPAVEIVDRLQKVPGIELRVVEPNLSSHHKYELSSLDEAISESDLILILVAHSKFRSIPPEQLAGKNVIDACGALVG